MNTKRTAPARPPAARAHLRGHRIATLALLQRKIRPVHTTHTKRRPYQPAAAKARNRSEPCTIYRP